MEPSELIWEESKRLLARQETSVDALHTRAFGVLSVGGVVGGLFGSRLAGVHLSGWQRGFILVALALFVTTVAVTVAIQWPRKWNFSHDLTSWVDDLRNKRPIEPIAMAVNLSRDLNNYRQQNAEPLEQRFLGLRAAYLLLGGQVVAWVLAVLL